MYICICHQITDRQIRLVVERGADSLGAVQQELPVGGCCGRCVESAQALISEQCEARGGAMGARTAAA
jgi:bacterioferritin-associated ferredoxin